MSVAPRSVILVALTVLLVANSAPAQTGGSTSHAAATFLTPEASAPFSGTGRGGAGPSAVILRQSGPASYGFLVNQIWSYAGKDDRSDVNQTFLQPFFSFRTKSTVTWTLQMEASANWRATSGQEWTVPLILAVSKVTKLGRKPISLGAGGGYFLEKPDGGPEWKFRSTLTLLFPS